MLPVFPEFKTVSIDGCSEQLNQYLGTHNTIDLVVVWLHVQGWHWPAEEDTSVVTSMEVRAAEDVMMMLSADCHGELARSAVTGLCLRDNVSPGPGVGELGRAGHCTGRRSRRSALICQSRMRDALLQTSTFRIPNQKMTMISLNSRGFLKAFSNQNQLLKLNFVSMIRCHKAWCLMGE